MLDWYRVIDNTILYFLLCSNCIHLAKSTCLSFYYILLIEPVHILVIVQFHKCAHAQNVHALSLSFTFTNEYIDSVLEGHRGSCGSLVYLDSYQREVYYNYKEVMDFGMFEGSIVKNRPALLQLQEATETAQKSWVGSCDILCFF